MYTYLYIYISNSELGTFRARVRRSWPALRARARCRRVNSIFMSLSLLLTHRQTDRHTHREFGTCRALARRSWPALRARARCRRVNPIYICVSLSYSHTHRHTHTHTERESLVPAERWRAAAGQLCEPERGVVLVGVEGDERADGAERGKAVRISHETVERVVCSKKINRSHTHTPTENNTPDNDTHTHAHDENNTPNEHLPQALNNARRCRDDGACWKESCYYRVHAEEYPRGEER